MSVKKVETVNQKMIDNPSEVQVGFDTVRGIIPRTVQIEVRNTGSSLVRTASMMLSLNSIHSFIFALILSKRMIPFRTTIQKRATNQMSPGKESGCQKITSHAKTQMSERGIVMSTSTDCL